MKRVLVTGSSGFVGWHLGQVSLGHWQLIGQYRSNCPISNYKEHFSLNLDQLDELEKAFDFYHPDGIIHLAAAANPNYCETHPKEAYHTNVEVTAAIARFALQRNIPCVFASTDLVFDGQHAPYLPTDIPAPVSQYGQQKLAAENILVSQFPTTTIARLPLMFGLPEQGSNFLLNWLNKWRSGESIPAFQDEYRTAVCGYDAAKGLIMLLEKEIGGIFHLGGRDRMSRYQFARLAAVLFGLPTTLIKPSWQADVKMAAARPADVSLNSRKTFQLGYRPKIAEEALIHLRDGLAF